MQINKIGLLLISLLILTVLNSAAPVPKLDAAAKKQLAEPTYKKTLLIDNFDDAEIKNNPAWWTFDRIQTTFQEAKSANNGHYYLKIGGKGQSYYVGGMGTYIGKDASDYDTFVVSILGSGPNSGVIRFQLYDDDNGNYQLEQDSTYKVLYDDYLEYELKVDWVGWRTVEIPLAKFVDMNPGVGDDIWNPDQKNGSGGLLQFQFVTLATTETGEVNFGIDNIKLVKKEN